MTRNVEMEKEETTEVKYRKAHAKKEKEAWYASIPKNGVTCDE